MRLRLAVVSLLLRTSSGRGTHVHHATPNQAGVIIAVEVILGCHRWQPSAHTIER